MVPKNTCAYRNFPSPCVPFKYEKTTPAVYGVEACVDTLLELLQTYREKPGDKVADKSRSIFSRTCCLLVVLLRATGRTSVSLPARVSLPWPCGPVPRCGCVPEGTPAAGAAEQRGSRREAGVRAAGCARPRASSRQLGRGELTGPVPERAGHWLSHLPSCSEFSVQCLSACLPYHCLTNELILQPSLTSGLGLPLFRAHTFAASRLLIRAELGSVGFTSS